MVRVKFYPVKESIEGAVKAPPSKSYTHRVLFIALLADGESIVEDILISGDTKATINAVRKFGGKIKNNKKIIGVYELKSPPTLYCRGSGTTIRIASAIAALTKGPVLLYGDTTLNRRPMSPLISALGSLGARILSRNGKPPLAICGFQKPKSNSVRIDASISSQFISALLIIAPMIGLTIETYGRLKSTPYVDMTLKVMEAFGARYEREGYRFFRVHETGYKPTKFMIPGDFSSASFILAMGALKGKVRVEGLHVDDVQGDKFILKVLSDMGAKVRVTKDYVEVESSGILEGIEVDCGNTPDLVPVIAVLGACAKGITRIYNIEHLVFKESNRLESIRRNLKQLGVNVRVRKEEIIIKGCNKLKGARLHSFNDHRIAMAFTIAALVAEGPIEIQGFNRVSDSYPQFLTHLKSLGVKFEVIK